MTQLMPQSTYMTSLYARQLLQEFAKTPAEHDSLMQNMPFSAAQLRQMNFIPFDAQMTQLENIIALKGQASSLAAPLIRNPAAHGAIDVVFRSAPTIGAGLALLAAYDTSRLPNLQTAFDVGQDGNAHLICTQRIISKPIKQSHWMWLMEIVCLSMSAMLDNLLLPADLHPRYDFPWPAPAHAAALRAMLKGKCYFDVDLNGAVSMTLSEKLMQYASPFANDAMLQAGLDELRQAMHMAAHPDLSARVMARLTHSDMMPKTSDLAKMLNMSQRSFERQLARENTSYRQLKDQILKRRALRLLQDPTINKETMAAALGYQDSASLSRAFQRWFGMGFKAKRNETKR